MSAANFSSVVPLVPFNTKHDNGAGSVSAANFSSVVPLVLFNTTHDN